MAAHPSTHAGHDQPLSRVELHISCTNLPNKDTFSKSDPQAIVYLASSGQWVEYARTEMINDNLNPSFVTPIGLDYFFETSQPLRVVVVDIDKVGGRVSEQDFLGSFDTTLASVMGARGQRVVGTLLDERGAQSRASITITGEEVVNMKLELNLVLAAHNLDKKDRFSRSSDPFAEICRAGAGASADNTHDASAWVPVLRTNVVKKNLNPRWDRIVCPVSRLVGSDIERRILIRVYDWNKKSAPDFIGEIITSIPQLEDEATSQVGNMELINPAKARKKKKYRNSGVLVVSAMELVPKPSFLDYIAGGCEISLVFGVDFTASNGNPSLPSSLHYMSPYEPNAYVRAMSSVGEVLAHYDNTQMFPAFGYGAKIPPTNAVSHCFPLNGNPNAPTVFGMDGVRQAYYQALQTVTLYGPTYFAPIIKACAAQAAQHATQESQRYMLLLILTDGIITDMDATTEAIVEASGLPMSIIIVGVGDADFSAMDVLDGDDVRLSANGRYAERDIVQFVPFRDFASAHPEMLARETLAELPAQFLSYMSKHGILPNPPPVLPATPAPAPASSSSEPSSTPPAVPSQPPPTYASTTQPGGPPPTYMF